MGIEVVKTHGNCCGHRAIGMLENVDLKTGKITRGYDTPILLKTLIKEEYDGAMPCALWSWIAAGEQKAYGDKLREEFEKLKYKVTRQTGIENPKSGNTLYMYIAKRTAESKV